MILWWSDMDKCYWICTEYIEGLSRLSLSAYTTTSISNYLTIEFTSAPICSSLDDECVYFLSSVVCICLESAHWVFKGVFYYALRFDEMNCLWSYEPHVDAKVGTPNEWMRNWQSKYHHSCFLFVFADFSSSFSSSAIKIVWKMRAIPGTWEDSRFVHCFVFLHILMMI